MEFMGYGMHKLTASFFLTESRTQSSTVLVGFSDLLAQGSPWHRPQRFLDGPVG
jgi:hypothetical protein